MPAEVVDCCVAGGGPAGAMAAYLLARAGLRVLLLEKHGDFLRDFRGDTIHPSTLRLLAELGLAERFLALPHQKVARIGVTTDEGAFPVADFSRLRGPFRCLVFVPQWDFLDFLVAEARRFPTFEVRMNAEAIGLVREDASLPGDGAGAVVGVRYRTPDGATHDVRSRLTLATDGRHSRLRAEAGLRLHEFGAPIDVVWFRLPKPQGTGEAVQAERGYGALGRLAPGRMLVRIDRGDYWQTGYLVEKGGFARVQEAGIAAFRDDLVRLVPDLAAAVGTLRSWDDVSVLTVRVDRLATWHLPGLLVLGDAAHAMSPVGGVGINLAIQDAVAAARQLAAPLRAGRAPSKDLAAVQRRRWLPTVLTQLLQRAIQARVLAPLLRGETSATPRALKVLQRFPVLQAMPARVIGFGVRPEHAPPLP